MAEVCVQSPQGYDIIGDVHGCADALVRLLDKLGYHEINGVFCHPHRQAIFAGDILDRGPGIREALAIVKRMCDAGYARMIMGNHEFDAIGYHTKAPADSGRNYLREHTERHTRLIAETLAQFEDHPQEWQDYLAWFKSLPLFIEHPNFRVVHAYWDQPLIDEMITRYGGPCINDDFIAATADQTSFEWRCISRLTRGADLPLPEGHAMVSAEGFERRSFRARFWGRKPKTYGELAFQPDPLPEHIASQPLEPNDDFQLVRYGRNERPLFVGHYWLSGRPAPVTDNLACLDYSAVKYGRLVAYSFDNETQLDANKYTWVHVDNP
ncbi:metallophosphoesterase [Simiduia agarivorans]|uniref:Serine/threonine protein phosphatase n=1 Tax=Simiduia agarivorans (strain DSM 21679 / JCM 13881 / BCRC 17597 / SA1) TaxID=1117647 RepID=K4KEE8_SIMAS|nr:metallophosphoesterase [Simiduia agarivorans]AFU97424.2 serine/threonine protein phosphatase [Simiduia agarivorans SA1 = DSM 21679]